MENQLDYRSANNDLFKFAHIVELLFRTNCCIRRVFACNSSSSFLHAHMTNPQEVRSDHLAAEQNEGGAPSRPKSNKATSWFVPPIVIPSFLGALFVARVVYQAYF
jgi:hypothetical protein